MAECNVGGVQRDRATRCPCLTTASILPMTLKVKGRFPTYEREMSVTLHTGRSVTWVEGGRGGRYVSTT